MINEFKDEYAFLSNMYPSKFTWQGTEYKSVEHAYQASKAKTIEEELYIASLDSPKEAKRYAKTMDVRQSFHSEKEEIMLTLLFCKFHQNPDLLKKLLDTGTQEIVEGNRWNDKFWGFCLKTNEGKNVLGKMLMKVRMFYIMEGLNEC
jgi:hypothetical protein